MRKNMMLKSAAIALLLTLVLGLALTAAGQAGTASISGTAFLDGNQNGLLDPGERGLEGVEVSLVKVSGLSETIIGQVRSGADGAWQFAGLAAGEYYLLAGLPGGFTFAIPEVADAPMLPASGTQSRSAAITLADGQQLAWPFGAAKRSAYINIVAFGDTNMNGGRMTSEPLLRDVEVSLVFEQGGTQHVVAQGTTNKDGELQLRDLSPATYRLQAVMPAPYIVGPLGAKINPFYNVILPGEANTGLSEPFTLERSLGVGIGGVKAGALSGRVWLDSNMNGVQDAGEGGLPGITLTLANEAFGISRSLQTGETAEFTFDHLLEGEYSLSASLPEGVMFALPGSPSLFDAGYSDTQSVPVKVREGIAAVLDPVGVMPASGLTVVAFHDNNVNGIPDEGEPAFMGAAVEVVDGETVLASATADKQGLAALPRVRQGDVTIRVSLPDGQVFTIKGGESGNSFSSISAASSLSVTRNLAPGSQLTLYAGATLPAAISGRLFEDSDLNGVMEGSEAGLEGFIVEAINRDGETAAQAVTGADGSYLLEGLVPDTYRVRFTLVSPYVFSQPSSLGQGTENKVIEQTTAYGQTEALTLGAGAAEEQVDAGAFRSAVIEGSVLLGDEEMGFEGQAGGLANVRVDLLDEDGQPVSEHTTAVSNAAGFFSLKGALPGSYSLSYTLPEGAKFSQPLTNEPIITGSRFEVLASDVIKAPAVYAVKTGEVSGLAFHDLNNNGLHDNGDAPLAGVQLTLTNKRTSEVYESATDAQGGYLLAGIRPGSYEARVLLPVGFALDANKASLVPSDITGQSAAELVIGMGTKVEQGLLAAVKPLTIPGHAFYDNDLNDAFDAAVDTPDALAFTLTHLRSGTMTALNADTAGQFETGLIFPGKYRLALSLAEGHLLTAPKGAASQQNSWTAEITLDETTQALNLALVELGSLSGAVWNMDGSGKDIGGLHITLQSEDGRMMMETRTDENGAFFFDRLFPVNYTLRASLPGPYRFARQVDTAQRTSVILSDQVGLDSCEGSSAAIKLGMGEQMTGLDIGMGAMGKLGDYAWLDLDRDGMQDAGEPGLPGLVIKLYQYGQLTAQTQTDVYGRYLFDSLFPGTYTLEADMPAELVPTIRQSEFRLVASVLEPTQEQTARAEGIIVPSGGRNLNADLGFVLKEEGRYPASLQQVPVKDWTQVNEQKPSR